MISGIHYRRMSWIARASLHLRPHCPCNSPLIHNLTKHVTQNPYKSTSVSYSPKSATTAAHATGAGCIIPPRTGNSQHGCYYPHYGYVPPYPVTPLLRTVIRIRIPRRGHHTRSRVPFQLTRLRYRFTYRMKNVNFNSSTQLTHTRAL